MKVCIIGTHGAGKTTLTYLVAAEAKKRGFNARVINEVARSCPFPLNDGFSIEGAHWIVTQQISKELSAKAAKTELIICDRSSIDPIMYLNAGKHNQREYQQLSDYAVDWMKTYDLIVLVTPDSCKIKEDGVRSTDIEFQEKVHNNFIYYTGIFYDLPMIVSTATIFSGKLEQVFKEIFDDLSK